MRSRRFISIFYAVPVITLLAVFLMPVHTKAFSNVYPDNADVSTGANIYMVSGQTQFVQQTDSNLRVWFVASSGTVTIASGNFCSSNSFDSIQNGDWFDSHVIPNGSPVTKFSVTGSTPQFGRKYAANDARCNDPIVFNLSGLSRDPEHPDYYFANIDIQYNNLHSGLCDGTSIAGCDGIMNYLKLTASSGGLIGVRAGFTGFDATLEQVDTSPANTNYTAKFGTSCSLRSGQTERAVLTFYDLDNAGGSGAQRNGDITVKLKDLTNGNYVNFIGSTGTVWTPPSIDNHSQQIAFTAIAQHKYQLEVYNVYYNNTIQFSLPYSQINYKPCPATTTTVTPSSSAAPRPARVGQSVAFTHSVTTTDYEAPPKTYQWRVWMWMRRSNGTTTAPTQVAIRYPQTTNADGTVVVNTNSQTVPNNVIEICQSLQLSRPSQNLITGPESKTCVPIVQGPTPNVDLVIASNAGSIKYVEPEEVAQNDNAGHLWDTVGRKPELANGEWGYIERAKQLDPVRVKDTEHIIGTYTQGSRTVDDSYAASCTRNAAGNCIAGTYSCPSGGSLSGATCVMSHTEWHYYCNAPGARDLGWHRSDPGCDFSYYDGCPDGTAPRYGTRGVTKNCNDAWVCVYGAGSTAFNNEGKPQCEYRCNNGMGLGRGDRAQLATKPPYWVSTKGRSYPLYGSGDTNCYMPWQVNLHCDISYVSGKWLFKDPSNGIPTSIDIVVDPNNAGNNLCEKYVKYYGEMVGDVACVQIRSSVSGFIDNGSTILRPDHQITSNGLIWGTRADPDTATQCFQTIARPFVSFNKTDVKAYNADINTYGYWSGSTHYGSTVDYAAYATTLIDGLKTYALGGNSTQNLRAFASPNHYNPPWGGNFGAVGSSRYGYYESVMTTGPNTCSNTLGAMNLSSSQVIYCPGSDVTITGPITANWKYKTPASLFVIARNITIAGNVDTLDGVGLVAENSINTCGGGDCGTQLRLTGFINAPTIHYNRAANNSGGSSVNCARPTRGSQPNTCRFYNNPAEVITYSPEFEVSFAPYKPTGGVLSGKYDSIRALPPIY